MPMFQSILPQNQQPEAPALPPGLLALLPKSAGITGGLAQDLASAAPFGGPTYAPGQQPLPSAVPGATNGPPAPPVPAAPAMSAPLIGAPPMMSPTEMALLSAGEAASKAKVYDSPLATLASSLLAGLQSGATSFAAQKQANAETKYKADLQSAKDTAWKTFVDDKANFPGPDGMQLQAALKGMDPAAGQKLMADVGMWKPEIQSFGKGGLYDARSGKVIQVPTGEVYKKGDAVQATNPDGTGKVDADGMPVMIYPAGKAGAIDQTSEAFKDKFLELFGADAFANPKPEQLAITGQKLQKGKIEVANAGAARSGDLSAQAFNTVAAQQLGPLTEALRAQGKAIPALMQARELLNGDKLNTGPWAAYQDKWNKMSNPERAANGERYTALMMSTIFPTLRATLGAQFTESEGIRLLNAAGGDRTMFKSTLKALVDDKINAYEPARVQHNNLVATTVGKYPTAPLYIVEPPQGTAPKGGADPTAQLPNEKPEDYSKRMRALVAGGK